MIRFCWRLLTLILIIWFVCLGASYANYDSSGTRIVHFLHTGAINGTISPPEEVGGWSSIAGYARKLTEGNANVFLFDCGDAFWGSGAALVTNGEATARLANATGYDAMLLGNLDVNSRALGKLTMPLLAGHSDFYRSYGDSLPTVNSTIIERGSLRIGVLGVLYGPKTSDDSCQVEAAEIAVLREQGAEFLVLLAHDAVGRDWGKYAELGVKVVLAHWSQFLPPSQAELEAATGIEFSYTTGVRKGSNLGHLTIEISNDGKIRTLTDEEIVFDATNTFPDSFVAESVRQEIRQVEVTLNEVVGTATTDFSHQLGSSSPAGELVLDAIRWRLHPDVVVYNSPGVRAGLKRGAIRYSDLLDMLPFGNSSVITELSGEQLLELCRNRNSNVLINGLRIDRSGAVHFDDKQIDTAAFYTVATNDYNVERGSGPFAVMKNGRNPVYGENIVSILVAYIRARGEIGASAYLPSRH